MKPSNFLILSLDTFVASTTHFGHDQFEGTQHIRHRRQDGVANAGQIEDLRNTDGGDRLSNRSNSACTVRTVIAMTQTYVQSTISKLTPATASSVATHTDLDLTSSASAVSDISSSTLSVNFISQHGTPEETEFPSGKIKCSDFPSQHGAIPIPWRSLHGWIGLQHVPDFTSASESINTITDIADCAPSTMCSYACKPGYQKSQWPQAQGSKGQSIGGLYCNKNGYLELTRPSVKQLCIPGEGGVFIQNDLSDEVVACRTDYPGTEGMFIPTVALPGEQVALTNPSQTSYYLWEGKQTSAQYYINPKGVSEADACIWGDSSSTPDRGNWAPIIVGVGKSTDNFTYVGLFLNQPTSTAKLDFNIEVVGGSIRCAYIDSQWYGGSTGCTSAFAVGRVAIVRYF